MTWSTRSHAPSFGAVILATLSLFFAQIATADFTITVEAEGVLDGAVLTATPVGGEIPPRDVPDKATMVQVNRQFTPFILPVPTNVPVEFPNRDNTAHHVYSFSEAGSFELPLYKGDAPEPIIFSKSGVVPLGCNIHDWMIGYIYVVGSPWYTQLENNRGSFHGLPQGTWEISLWHPSLEGQVMPSWQVSVDGSQAAQTLALEYPFVAVTQPEAPAERFDEQWDY